MKRLGSLHDIDIRLLRIFVAITDCGGITAAEPKLNLANSTISTHLSQLEGRLRLTLCRRGRAGFELTNDGRTVYDAAVRMLESIETFRLDVEEISASRKEGLRIVVPDSLMYSIIDVLAPVVREFTADVPQVLLDIDVAAPEAIDAMLLDGSADIGIGSPTRRTQNLLFQDLKTEIVALYCGEMHPLNRLGDSQLTPEKILEYDIVQARGYYYPKSITRLLPPGPASTCSPLDGRVVMAASGRFLAFIAQDYAQPFVKQGLLREIGADAFRYENRISAAMRRGRTGSRAEQFFEYLQHHVRKAA